MLEKLIYANMVFMGFAAIMNPIASISIFLTLTANETEEEARKIARQSTLTAAVIVAITALAGGLILKFFNISYIALRLTGGILVGLIGYEMLFGKHSHASKPHQETIDKAIEEESSIAITPLGIPLLAGPGVIITAMNFSQGGGINIFITIFAFSILCVITYYCFIFGKEIKKIIGASALKVITRMMGLILAVIGMQMFLEGVYSAINEFRTINII